MSEPTRPRPWQDDRAWAAQVEFMTNQRGGRARAIRSEVIDFKQDLLLFDEIGIMGFERRLARSAALDPALAADAEYLANLGILQDAPLTGEEMADATELMVESSVGVPRDQWRDVEFSRDHHRALRLVSMARHPAGADLFWDPLPSGGELIVALGERLAGNRSTVALMRSRPPAPNIRRLERAFWMPGERALGSPEAVVELVLPRLPVPGPEVPLSDVVDFTQDPATRDMLARLRLWMARLSLEGSDAGAMELELEEHLHELRSHLRIADMRHRTSVIRAVLTIPLGLAEELLHLRPKGAVEALFSVRDEHANFLEAQLSAPGHEVAYIEAAHRAFR